MHGYANTRIISAASKICTDFQTGNIQAFPLPSSPPPQLHIYVLFIMAILIYISRKQSHTCLTSKLPPCL